MYRLYRIGLHFFSILSSNLMKKVEIIKVFSQMETPIRTWRNHKSKILLHKKKVFLINFILVFYIFSVWISSFTSLNKGRKFPKRFLSFLCFGEFQILLSLPSSPSPPDHSIFSAFLCHLHLPRSFFKDFFYFAMAPIDSTWPSLP